MRPPVDTRRPFIVVAAGAALAVVASLVTGVASGMTGDAVAPPPPAPSTAAAPPCTGVAESLRPGPLPPPGQMPDGTTMARIQQRGRLIAAVDQSKFRVGYRNPSTGALEGADIDVVRAIAAAILGNPDKVQYVVTSIADRAPALQAGRVDVVVNTFSITCERQRLVSFSVPYQTVTQRLLVQRDSGIRDVRDLAGKTVCTSAVSVPEQVLKKIGGFTVLGLAGTPDCIVELQAGRVQAISNDDVILAGLAAQDPQTEVVGGDLSTSRSGVAVPLGDDAFVRFVNGVLERSRADGSLAKSNHKWFEGYLPTIPQMPPPVYRD